MSELGTPYRFVPLSQLVLLPDWGHLASHDHPFQDGVCGELELTLTCHTPLCVGGEQTKSSKEAPGKVHVFRAPDGRPAIPGASLKGMLRNVLEIAALGRFKQVEDQRLGVRDISSSDNFYTRAIVQTPVQAGWLCFKDGEWHIQPCTFSRLHQQDLIQWRDIALPRWAKAKSAKDRYELIGLLPSIRFATQPHKTKTQVASPEADGPLQGRVVVTGQPGEPFNEGRHSKKFEFIFHDKLAGAATSEQLTVTDEVMRGFMQIHQDSNEWAFWRAKLAAGSLDTGIPVFFHRSGSEVSSLGLAMMYKLPYRHSLHQAITHTHAAHLQGQAPDLADLIFGRIDDEHGSLRGRVGIGMAHLSDDQDVQTQTFAPTVLSSPKPTFYPAYIRQDRNRFRQLMEPDAELAGWKRYPPAPVDVAPAPAKSGPTSQVVLEAVPEGTRFRARVHLHNLRRVELGALLWIIDFGRRTDRHHGLGMGKPYGLGQVSLQLGGWQLRANDPAQGPGEPDAVWLDACRREFIDLMDQSLEAAGAGAWEASDPIKALLDLARPARTRHGLDYLGQPKDYVRLRHPESLGESRAWHEEYQGIRTGKGFDTTRPRGWQSRFDDNLAAAAQAVAKAEDRERLQQQLADATPEQALLLEIERWLAQYHESGGAGSSADNLNAALRKALEDPSRFVEDDHTRLAGLVGQCRTLDSKKIQKACRKFDSSGATG